MLCNGPIDWSSKLIRVLCHSSSEAEIGASCALGKRAVFIRLIMGEFYIKFGKFILLIDNTAAIDLSKKLGVGTRTAHFLRWQHYLRWLVLHGYIELIFVGTKDQLADLFTKVLEAHPCQETCTGRYIPQTQHLELKCWQYVGLQNCAPVQRIERS